MYHHIPTKPPTGLFFSTPPPLYFIPTRFFEVSQTEPEYFPRYVGSGARQRWYGGRVVWPEKQITPDEDWSRAVIM